MSKFICLDFDGVICNSINECLLVGYNAYFDKNITDLNSIPKKLRDFFYDYRYFVRPAKGFYVLFKAFELGIKDLDINSFEKLKDDFAKEVELFEGKFYNKREILKLDFHNWIGLNKIYENSRNFLENSKTQFFIITNKDKKSVKDILGFYGYDLKVRDIYSKDLSNDKNILFDLFMQDYDVDLKRNDVIFIDDSLENLRHIKYCKKELKVYFASWGYDKTSCNNIDKIENLNFLIG